MELHIYREGCRDRIVKDNTKQNVLYTIGAPWAFFSNPPMAVFRGTDGTEQIATITKSGYWNPKYIIELQANSLLSTPDTVTVLPPSWVFCSKSTFSYDGREYVWRSDKELSCEGKVIAVFKRTCFSWRKKGVLRIDWESEKLVDVIVITAIAMQYRWEEKRSQSRAGAGGGGV